MWSWVDGNNSERWYNRPNYFSFFLFILVYLSVLYSCLKYNSSHIMHKNMFITDNCRNNLISVYTLSHPSQLWPNIKHTLFHKNYKIMIDYLRGLLTTYHLDIFLSEKISGFNGLIKVRSCHIVITRCELVKSVHVLIELVITTCELSFQRAAWPLHLTRNQRKMAAHSKKAITALQKEEYRYI